MNRDDKRLIWAIIGSAFIAPVVGTLMAYIIKKKLNFKKKR